MAAPKILLVGWDAADWKVIRPLMDEGRMPNIQRLVQHGAAGQMATLHPPLSPMLWTSVATGKRPFQHGIHGFTEPTPGGRGVQPITNLSRKSKALWNILTQNGLRSVVVGWWPSHPAEPIDGVMVSDLYHHVRGPVEQGWPMLAHTVHPPELAATIAGLRMHPDCLTPPMVEPFVPLAREIDQNHDKRLGQVMRTLAECLSIQSAAAWLLDHQHWDFFAVYLDSIDHFSHGFMRYHPPRQSWIDERDFELYQNVVAMAYELHDRMLGMLLQKAGPETTVIVMSDHGFHPDHLRPSRIPDMPAGPAVEHRDAGILAMSGPAIRRGESLYGASLLDIAPTILTLYGLPVGEDMDGKVLVQAFEGVPEVQTIPTWETVAGKDGRHPPHTQLDAAAAHEALEQMIALGYVQRPGEVTEAEVVKTIRELRYNLGEAFQDAARHAEAERIFAELCAADPDEERFAVHRFASCQALGMHAEMRSIVEDLDGRRRAVYEEARRKVEDLLKAGIERAHDRRDPGASAETMLSADERRELAHWRNLARYQPGVVDYLKAQTLLAERRYDEALAAFERLPDARRQPGVALEIAGLLARQGRLAEARGIYRQALELDPDNARAHLGLSRVAVRQRDFHAAAQSALDALERNYADPWAHFLLGCALRGMKQHEQAAEAFRAAISLNPNFPQAHLRLAALLEGRLGEAESAREHRVLARRMKQAGGGPATPVEEQERGPRRSFAVEAPVENREMAPVAESLIVVTGLPRSGTSLLMQMLAAGGVRVVADGRRAADGDNPRGYWECDRVKALARDSKWLVAERGKAVKIVLPLLAHLPEGLPCRVILAERDLDEVLDSQQRMRERREAGPARSPERRQTLKQEYERALAQAIWMLARRPATSLLVIEYGRAVADPRGTAEQLSKFLGGGWDVHRMAAAVDARLHRNRRY